MTTSTNVESPSVEDRVQGLRQLAVPTPACDAVERMIELVGTGTAREDYQRAYRRMLDQGYALRGDCAERLGIAANLVRPSMGWQTREYLRLCSEVRTLQKASELQTRHKNAVASNRTRLLELAVSLDEMREERLRAIDDEEGMMDALHAAAYRPSDRVQEIENRMASAGKDFQDLMLRTSRGQAWYIA